MKRARPVKKWYWMTKASYKRNLYFIANTSRESGVMIGYLLRRTAEAVYAYEQAKKGGAK